ncbi:MAG: type II toxin-antitoxin system VapC family toxin [Patescibacteria group bacterium]|jgi:predicted nucleic acid-binding protein
MVVFDANVWVALLNANDSLHAKAKSVEQKAKRPILLPEYIAVEVCNVLTQRAGKITADRFLEVVTGGDVELLYAGKDTFSATCSLSRQITHKKLSFVDVFLLLLSKEHDVITFDKALIKAMK